MLNEWSDRTPPGPKPPLWRRSELWLGLVIGTVTIGQAINIAAWLLGLAGLALRAILAALQ